MRNARSSIVPRRVYVAGASVERARHEPKWAMAELRRVGIEIAYDWIAKIEQVGIANPTEDDRLAREVAKIDLAAVRHCDLVWILTPESKEDGCGLWCELGAAAALGKCFVVSGL
jgi:hypothetical protein